ncbi:LysM peptidoglycan-binding domain-containing protein [Evansella cellulosilytica]|uniref:NLP/P60 protein n=1 Tax=Evansella cellulosilytica (strain ATCC 21833 / DSM 2522 / FERM P-1141 / JCM 9156 / N-4) TaxID=649639 RepID=E6U1D1_EVAC2|nr:peptidoglycan endopeptidase [Evansella cellulosilytica]ADU29178.1 NLP/P60 protein [Evansella cellulosilytica DSM 2522]
MKKYLISAATTATLAFLLFTGKVDAQTYHVQSGDSLWRIANNNQVTVQQLMTWNNLSSSTIFVGQSLTVQAQQARTYTVKSGDSLSVIARNHNTTVNAIRSLNNLSSDLIRIGQVLQIPSSSNVQQVSNNTQNVGSYTVKSGDSLSVIARNYNTTVAELRSLNGLNSDLIRVGQVLQVPQAQSGNQSQQQSATTYTVRAGDSLWKIATDHNLTVNQLRQFNNLSSDVIRVGQVLRLTSSSNTNNTSTNNTTSQVQQGFNVEALIEEARKHIGVPYVWGGSTTRGFDCSGYLQYVFNTQGISIPRTVATIWNATTPVSTPRVGDIVFFETYTSGPSHAGIFIGNNQFIHAGSSTGVTITSMNNSYWSQRYLGARSVR